MMLTNIKNFISDKWQKFKKIIIIAIFGGVALAAGLGATPENPDTVIANHLPELQSLMETDKQPNGKYKYRPLEIVQPLNSEMTSYQIDEYETSKGEIGYTVYIEKTEGNLTYRMATSTGILKNQFDYKWKIIKDKTASTTP